MKKPLIFILVGVIVVCLIGACVFLATLKISATNKENAYFDVYKSMAADYIRISPEIIAKYGEDNLDLDFGTISYYESGRTTLGIYVDYFFLKVPDTIEEFSKNIKDMSIEVTINGDDYQVNFLKNEQGNLVVIEVVEVVD